VAQHLRVPSHRGAADVAAGWNSKPHRTPRRA
jgi:hypothetical protein